jgi:hypothetical protein
MFATAKAVNDARLARMNSLRLSGSDLAHLALYGSDVIGEAPAGYHSRVDAIDHVPGSRLTRDGQPISEIWNEMQQRNNLFNQHTSFVVSLLTFSVTRPTDKVGVYSRAKFEQATEFGRPSKIRLAYQTRGFPLDHFDLGYGFTVEFLDDADSRQITQMAAQAESAYWDLQYETALLALFENVNATDKDGVSVSRLYNNDGEVPPAYKRWEHDGTHTHYAVGATLTEAVLNSLEEHLIHHGYGDNGETLVLHIHRDQVATVQALAKFVPASEATRPSIIDGPVRGQERSAPSGLEIVGYHNKLVIVENNMIPTGYIVLVASGGALSAQNVIGLRQHENPSARGLRLIEGGRTEYPLVDSVYDCYMGAGVRHRGAAAVFQITAGAYEVPEI